MLPYYLALLTNILMLCYLLTANWVMRPWNNPYKWMKFLRYLRNTITFLCLTSIIWVATT